VAQPPALGGDAMMIAACLRVSESRRKLLVTRCQRIVTRFTTIPEGNKWLETLAE
jgi:hypothetical protein